jgi:hypothetical protein
MSDEVVRKYAQCAKQCAESQSQCLSNNASVQGSVAICSGQEALCQGSCANDLEKKSAGLSKAVIAWIVVFAIMGAAVIVYATLYAQRHGYITKMKRMSGRMSARMRSSRK